MRGVECEVSWGARVTCKSRSGEIEASEMRGRRAAFIYFLFYILFILPAQGWEILRLRGEEFFLFYAWIYISILELYRW